MSHVSTVNVMGVVPSDIAVWPLGDFAVAHVGHEVGLFPAIANGPKPRSMNASIGQLQQIGERLVAEAKRAGHEHRRELRTHLLAEAVAS